MNRRCHVGRCACLAGLALFALPTLASAKEARPAPNAQGRQASDSDQFDEDLIISGGPVLFVTNRLGPTSGRAGIKFLTDPCGLLRAVENSRSMVRLSAMSDDDGDDADGDSDADPADQARLMIGRWLSEHPELLVINDGVAKSCDDNEATDVGDEPLQTSHATNRRARSHLRRLRPLPIT